MPIESMPRYQLYPAELCNFSSQLCSDLSKVPADAQMLHAVANELAGHVAALEARTGEKSQNIFSGPLYEADVRRDTCFSSNLHYIRGAQYHPDLQLAADSQKLYALHVQHGTDLDRQSYAVETHKLTALMDDLDKPEYKAAVERLGMSTRYAELREANQKFKRLHQERINADAQNILPELSQFIGPMRRCIREALIMLGSLERQQPQAMKPIIDEVNQLITTYAANVHARTTRRKKKENPDDTPAAPGAAPVN